MHSDITLVGLDLGRGRVKGISYKGDEERKIIFPSVMAPAYGLDLDPTENRIHISIDGLDEDVNQEWFVGDYALEQQNIIEYTTDSKTDIMSQILLATALSLLVDTPKCKVALGVPKSMYTKEVLETIKSTYLHKKITVQDKVDGKFKQVEVVDITIFSEASASAIYLVSEQPELKNTDFGIANFGFKTLEKSYFSAGVKYVEGLSSSEEFGNMDVLEEVKKRLSSKKELQQIDIETSGKYSEELGRAYSRNRAVAKAKIERSWRQQKDDMKIFVTGGTAMHLNLDYPLINDSQFSTARGLYLVAQKAFNREA